MTFPPDSHFNQRPEHTLPPPAHRTPPPKSDIAEVPIPRIEDWYRTLNGYVPSDGSEVLEDLRDEIYSYLRG